MTTSYDWKLEKEIEHKGIVVVINTLELKFPKYSLSISRRTGGKTSRHIQAEISEDGVFVTGVAIAEALQLAAEYITEKVKAVEEKHIAETRRQARGIRGLSGGHGSGKTQRERDKRKGVSTPDTPTVDESIPKKESSDE